MESHSKRPHNSPVSGNKTEYLRCFDLYTRCSLPISYQMSILNDCTTIGELVERAEHLKPSQRGRLGDVQAVEGQPGQGQGVREHHQVIISIIMDYFTLIREGVKKNGFIWDFVPNYG